MSLVCEASPGMQDETSAAPTWFPCSSAQERCWFIDAMKPGNTALNVALRWELKGTLGARTIEDAFSTVIERHEALRTRIIDQDGTPVQEVLPPFRLPLDIVDLSDLPEARRAEEILRLGRIEAHKPFDLARPPLIRTTLLRLAPDRSFLLLTIHQIAFDGWSIRLISHEFGTIAAAIDAGEPHGLPELQFHYGDYAAWQTAFYRSGRFEREVAYWRGQLESAPYFEVPGVRERQARPTFNGEIIAEILPDRLEAAMARATQAQGVTTFAFGCAVIAAVLRRLTGADDIVIGTQIAGRDETELEPIIGVFINNLVLRFDLSGQPTFLENLKRVNRIVQEALINQRMPFHRLVHVLKAPRDPRRMPLISINFTVLQQVMSCARYGTFELVGHPSLSAGSLYDLNFFMVQWPTGWRMALEYNQDLFDRSTSEAILRQWREFFELAVETGDFTIDDPAFQTRQAKTGSGGRVEDVEDVLNRQAEVAEAVVLAAGDDERTPARAFVIPRPNVEGSLDDLRAELLDRLRTSMTSTSLPDAIDVRMAFPRLPDGSVDRTALAQTIARKPAVLRAPSSSVRSRGDKEAVLLGIWRDVLDTWSIELDDNFFDCGGHSLLALRMLSRVRTAFGQGIDVTDLFAAPTVRSLAARIEIEPPKYADWTIVPIQPAGTRIPIIVINNTVIYYNLARRLGTDRPVIGVQMFDPEAEQPLEKRAFENIASDYVELIKAVRPSGPYILMGLCVAGAIAYEVARQLREAGHHVPLVIAADTWCPAYLARLPPLRSALFRLSYRWHVAKHHLRDLRSGARTLSEVLATYPSLRRTRILDVAAALGLVDKKPLGREDWGNRWFLPHLEEARDNYAVRPGKDTLVVLRSDEMILPFADQQLGWAAEAADRLVTADIPGWHTGMFQGAGAGRIAEVLAPLLAEADATVGPLK